MHGHIVPSISGDDPFVFYAVGIFYEHAWSEVEKEEGEMKRSGWEGDGARP